MRTALALAVVLSAVALGAAGCGGGTPSPAEEWAGSVCTDVDDWANQIKGLAGEIQSELDSPSLGIVSEIQQIVQEGVAATKRLARDLKAVGAPPVENGETAKALLDSLADDVQQTVDQVEKKAKAIPESPSLNQAALAIASIAGDISATAEKAKSTVDSVKQLSGDLQDAFESAGSCKDLQKTLGR